MNGVPPWDIVSDEELDARAAELARQSHAGREEDALSLELLGFRLGSQWYVVDVHAVREVLLNPRVSWVPCVPSFVPGLVNVRGEVLWSLDPARILGSPGMCTGERKFALVVRWAAFEAALLVDEVDAVARSLASDAHSPAASFPSERRRFFKRVRRSESRGFIPEIDLEKFMEHEDLLRFREG